MLLKEASWVISDVFLNSVYYYFRLLDSLSLVHFIVIEIWEWTGKVSGSTLSINMKVGEIKSPRSQLVVPALELGRPDSVSSFPVQYVSVFWHSALCGLWADPLITRVPGICFIFSCAHSLDRGPGKERPETVPLLEPSQEQVLLTGFSWEPRSLETVCRNFCMYVFCFLCRVSQFLLDSQKSARPT